MPILIAKDTIFVTKQVVSTHKSLKWLISQGANAREGDREGRPYERTLLTTFVGATFKVVLLPHFICEKPFL
jgi:hypothetical protein